MTGSASTGFVDEGQIPEALVRRAELLEQAQELGVIPNPLDLITNAFGDDNVALIVGDNAKTRAIEAREFQEGTRQVAVISAAGATGISLDHRVFTAEGAKGRRVFLDVQYEWSATEAIQRYGRVDRAAQVSAPKIMAINSGSASEKKFLATVANRMASLGALSKGGAATTGASALEEFEINGGDSLIAARNAWAAQSDEDRDLWMGHHFRDVHHPGHPADITFASMREINMALLWLPTDVANRFWESFVTERARIRDAMGYADAARTQARQGEVLREVQIAPDLTLYQLRNEAGHRFGLLQGVVMPKMPQLRAHLTGVESDFVPVRRYLTFTDTKNDRVISGLEIPWTRVKGVAAQFGTQLGGARLNTLEDIEAALRVGDHLTLEQTPDPEKPWQIRMRTDRKVVIDGAKIRDRELLLRHGARYNQVGSFWDVADLPKFLERFPVKQPEGGGAKVEGFIEEDEEEGGGTSALPITSARPGQLPPPTPGPPGAPAPTPTARMRPAAIIEALKKALGGVPIKIGHFRERAHGIHKGDIRSIRLKVAEDLRTVFHEAGHDFDKEILKIDRKDARWKDELIKLGQATSKPYYSQKEQRTEGAAEFFAAYMSDPAYAQQEAPHYFAEFERRLAEQPDLQKVMHQVRSDLQGYLAQSHATRGRLAIDREGREKTVLQKAKDDPRGAIRLLASRAVDDLHALKVAVQTMAAGQPLAAVLNAYTLARIARGSASTAEDFLSTGVRGLDGKFIGPSLANALTPVKDRLDVLGDYLVARHALERWRYNKNPGMSREQARDIIRETKARPDFAELEQAATVVYKYNNALLDYMQLYGLLNAQQVRAMRAKYQYYVPLQRVMDDQQELGGPSARRIANRRAPVYRAVGSGRAIIDPLESIVKNTYAAVDAAQKNAAAQALTAQAAGAKHSARFIEKIPALVLAARFNLQQLETDIVKAMKRAGIAEEDIPDNFTDALDQPVIAWHPALKGKESEHIITVVRNGKFEFWQVNDPALYEAMTQIGPEMTDRWFSWFAEPPTKLLRTAATLTPGFITRNPFRDTLVAFLQSRYGFLPFIDTIRGLIGQVRGDEDAKLFFSSGIAQAAMTAQDRTGRRKVIEELKRSKGKQFLHMAMSPIDVLRAFSSTMEVASRLGEFKAALDAGGVERGVLERLWNIGQARPALTENILTQATLAARDVTTDFSRAGTVVRDMNRYWAFFNAHVQGYARMQEALKRDPVGVSLKLGMIAAMSAALWALNADDDEYEELPEWEKHVVLALQAVGWHLPTYSKTVRVGLCRGPDRSRAQLRLERRCVTLP